MSSDQQDQQSTEEPRPRRRWWLIAISIVVALAGVAWGAVWLLTPDRFTVNGSVELKYPCTGAGYSDVRDGAQVEIVNKGNEVIGVGRLAPYVPCSWSFYVNDVPAGEDLYGVRVGNQARGVLWKTETEARKVVSLTLG